MTRVSVARIHRDLRMLPARGRARAGDVPALDGGPQSAYRLPMPATDHTWQPWLRIQRVLRVMLETEWGRC